MNNAHSYRATPASLLVVLDCDSTLIQDEVIELIADAAGTRKEVALITERAMLGELDFAESLAERVLTLKGVQESVFESVLAQVRVTPGASELIEYVKGLGGLIAVVSGGFHEVLDPLAESLGVDLWRANRLELEDALLTGATLGPVIDGNAKAEALEAWAQEYGVPLEHTIAIGDGANDIPMMGVAGLSIAFNAKPKVRKFAKVQIEDDLSRAIPHIEQLGPFLMDIEDETDEEE